MLYLVHGLRERCITHGFKKKNALCITHCNNCASSVPLNRDLCRPTTNYRISSLCFTYFIWKCIIELNKTRLPNYCIREREQATIKRQYETLKI